MADPTMSNRPTTPKAQPISSQPVSTRSSPIKSPLRPIDGHKRKEWREQIYLDVEESISVKYMPDKLCPNYEKINNLAPVPPKMRKTTFPSKKEPDSIHCEYLNKFSEKFKKDQGLYASISVTLAY